MSRARNKPLTAHQGLTIVGPTSAGEGRPASAVALALAPTGPRPRGVLWPTSSSTVRGPAPSWAAPVRSAARPTGPWWPPSTRRTADDTEAAIAAARTGLRPRTVAAHQPAPSEAPCWTGSPTPLERHRDEFARAESLDTGKRLVESQYDMDDVIAVFRYYAQLAAEDSDREVDARPHRRAQPRGARTGRRLRADHAVELPAAADVVEGRARAWPPATPSSSSPAS